MARLSIIVGVYNTPEDYLIKCIESLQNQTMSDIEILLVNDGSTDKSGEICEKYAKIDSRIKVIHQKNGGISVARNTGIDNAKSDWISFVDSDDWVELDMCENICNALSGKRLDILATAHADNIEGNEIKQYFGEENFHLFNYNEHELMQLSVLKHDEYSKQYPMFFGAVWKCVYRRDFLKEHNIRSVKGLSRAQDSIFNLYALQYATSIGYMNEVTYNYRIHPESVCHSLTKDVRAYSQLLDEIKKFCIHFEKDHRFISSYNKSGLIFFIEIMKLYFFHKDNKKNIQIRREEFLILLTKEPFKTIFSNLSTNSIESKKRKILLNLIKQRNFYTLSIVLKIYKYST